MGRKGIIIRKIYDDHIHGTPKGIIVPSLISHVCYLSVATHKGVVTRFPSVEMKVYISARSVKHMQEKRSLSELDLLLDCLYKVSKFPTRIYKDKDPKRGSMCFVREVRGILVLCALEIMEDNNLHIVTAFKTSEKYLRTFELLWRWKDDTPSS